LNVYYYELFSRRVRIRAGIRFSVWFVIGYAHASVLRLVVIVTLPNETAGRGKTESSSFLLTRPTSSSSEM